MKRRRARHTLLIAALSSACATPTAPATTKPARRTLPAVVAAPLTIERPGPRHPRSSSRARVPPTRSRRTRLCTVHFEDAPLSAVAAELTRQSHTAVRFVQRDSRQPEPRVTLALRDLDVRSICRIIARFYGLTLREVDGSFELGPVSRLELRGAPLREAIQALAREAGVNCIVDASLHGTVDFDCRGLDPLSALRAIVANHREPRAP